MLTRTQQWSKERIRVYESGSNPQDGLVRIDNAFEKGLIPIRAVVVGESLIGAEIRHEGIERT